MQKITLLAMPSVFTSKREKKDKNVDVFGADTPDGFQRPSEEVPHPIATIQPAVAMKPKLKPNKP
jgi:hypothetical protein